jgi:hypothetical protein
MEDLPLGLAWLILFALCGTSVGFFALAAMGMDTLPGTGPSRDLLFDVPISKRVTLSVTPIASFAALTGALDAIRRLPDIGEARAVGLRDGTGVFEAVVPAGLAADSLTQALSERLGARVTTERTRARGRRNGSQTPQPPG